MRGCNRGREGGREEEIKAQRIEGKEVSVNKLISLEQQNLLFARRLDSGGAANVKRGEAKKKKKKGVRVRAYILGAVVKYWDNQSSELNYFIWRTRIELGISMSLWFRSYISSTWATYSNN